MGDNVKLREELLESSYQSLNKLDAGSKEYAAVVEAIAKLEQAKREDQRLREEFDLRAEQLKVDEQIRYAQVEAEEIKVRKAWYDHVLEWAKVIGPTVTYLFVSLCLIPKAEKEDVVPPSVKTLDPRRFKFWDR